MRSALELFEAEVAKPDEQIDLVRAAALLALHADPQMDPEAAVMQPLRELAVAFRERLEAAAASIPGDPSMPESVRLHLRAVSLCAFMEEKGFTGPRTEEGYYDAANSCMDKVLETRQGIPITLSLAYMAVGRAGGLELHGLNFPGHFLLGFSRGESAGLLDAFTNSVLTEADAAALFRRLWGVSVQLQRSWRSMPRVPNIAFLQRMVRNLQTVYERNGNLMRAAQVTQYARRLEAYSSQ